MRGWRQQYDYFAGQRYPSLIAYAQLLTGNRNRADALVDHSLRRTFGRQRRLGTNAEVEAEIRRQIVARFLATTSPDDVAEPVVAAPVVAAPEPAKQPEVDPALYAPPSEPTTARARTVLHTESAAAPESRASQTGAPNTDEQDPASPCAERPGESDADQTRAALGGLSPQARAITVLRHYDGLRPGTIAEDLGLSPDEVVRELRASHDVLRARLGIAIADEPDHAAAAPGDNSQQVVVTSHKGRRWHE